MDPLRVKEQSQLQANRSNETKEQSQLQAKDDQKNEKSIAELQGTSALRDRGGDDSHRSRDVGE